MINNILNNIPNNDYDLSQGSVEVPEVKDITLIDYFNEFLECGRFKPLNHLDVPCRKKQWYRIARYAYHGKDQYRLFCICGCQYDVGIVQNT